MQLQDPVAAAKLTQAHSGAMNADDETFEEVDLPGLRTKDGIADIDGNYPSKGARGEHAAWFRVSEGNLLGVGQPVV